MIICYMPKSTKQRIKDHLKNIKLTNAEKKWINEMLQDTNFIPKHRIDYLYRNFGLELKPIEVFEDNKYPRSTKEEHYRVLKPYIKNKLNKLMWKLAYKGDIKIDYEKRFFTFDKLRLNWDEVGLYNNGKLVAYINQRLDNIVKIIVKG